MTNNFLLKASKSNNVLYFVPSCNCCCNPNKIQQKSESQTENISNLIVVISLYNYSKNSIKSFNQNKR